MYRKRIGIIGAGHNGLVAAAYLASAGHEVHVYEGRDVVGGCASNDTDSFPGVTLSKAAYVNSLMDTKIVLDLNLERFGYEVLLRDPSSFTPLPDHTYLLLGHNMERNQKEIRQFSQDDAARYPDYVEALEGPAAWIEGMMPLTPPNIPPASMRDWGNFARTVRHAVKLSPRDMLTLLRLGGDPVTYLDSWFKSRALKATLLTDALIGTTEFSGYVLLHHVMGMAGGARGVWGYMRGGMGALSEAIERSATERGAVVYLKHRVVEITNTDTDGSVTGLVIEDAYGKRSSTTYDIVVSGVDPNVTFGLLRPRTSRQTRVMRRVKRIRYTSATMKVNAVLKGKPRFLAEPPDGSDEHLRGTIHIAPSVDYVRTALRDLRKGKPSFRPILEITIPSVVDPSLAPSGMHVMSILVQFTPYHHPEGVWNEETRLKYWKDSILTSLCRFAPDIEKQIVWAEVLAPPDLERELGLTGGSLFHGDMVASQLFFNRPVRGMADYRTPFPGLYLCGSGTHPGGGVTGAPGRNAAKEILRDLGSL